MGQFCVRSDVTRIFPNKKEEGFLPKIETIRCCIEETCLRNLRSEKNENRTIRDFKNFTNMSVLKSIDLTNIPESFKALYNS